MFGEWGWSGIVRSNWIIEIEVEREDVEEGRRGYPSRGIFQETFEVRLGRILLWGRRLLLVRSLEVD